MHETRALRRVRVRVRFQVADLGSAVSLSRLPTAQTRSGKHPEPRPSGREAGFGRTKQEQIHQGEKMKKSTVSSVLGTGLVVAGLTLAGVAVPAFAHPPAVAPASADSPEAVAGCGSHSVMPAGSETIAAQPAAGGNPAAVVTQIFVTSHTVTWLDPESGLSYLVVTDEAGTDGDQPLPETTASFPGSSVECVTTASPIPTPSPTPTLASSPVVEPAPAPAPAPTPTPTTPASPARLTVPATAPDAPTPAPTTPAAAPALNPALNPAGTPAMTPTGDSRQRADTGTQSPPVPATGFLAVIAGAGALLLARWLRRAQH